MKLLLSSWLELLDTLSTKYWSVFATALIISITFNEINLAYVERNWDESSMVNIYSTVHSSTIWSIDNQFYLPYIENLLNGNGYTLNPDEPELRVRRTPGYPLFYGFFRAFFGAEWAHFLIRYVQVVLFALSAVMVGKISLIVSRSPRVGVVSGFLYALNPFIFSACYFTLPEALYPFLICLGVYLFVLTINKAKPWFLLGSGAVLGLAILTKPIAGVALIAVIAAITFRQFTFNALIRNLKAIVLVCSGVALVISPWAVRNWAVTGEVILTEKFYHEAPMNFGKAHVELRKLTATWTNPANFPTSDLSSELRSNIKNGRRADNEEVIRGFLESWPKTAYQGYSKEELFQAIKALESCFYSKHLAQVEGATLRKDILTLPCEEEVQSEFLHLRKNFKAEAPVSYYLLTPLIMVKELVFNSHLHAVAILNPQDGSRNAWQFGSKALAYLFYSALYVAFFILILVGPIPFWQKAMLSIPAIVLFWVLIFWVRYAEVRYLLVLQPFIIISAGMFAQLAYKRSIQLLKRT